MRHVEGALETAAIGVLPLSVEDGPVEVNVVAVDGSVESDGDHLRHLSRIDVPGHSGTIGGTETVGKLALAQVTVGRSIGILYIYIA